MITRGRSRQSASQDPIDIRSPAVTNPIPLVGTTRTRNPEPRRTLDSTAPPKKNAVPSDSKKRVTNAPPKIVRELDSLDPEGSDFEVELIVDPVAELERLRKRMTEIEAIKKSGSLLKVKQSQSGIANVGSQDPSPPERRGNPAEGRSLGTFNGKTDLDTFLVRLETCNTHFGWSKSEKVFYLINALTESAEPIVKEVGPGGTLERILELLQSISGIVYGWKSSG